MQIRKRLPIIFNVLICVPLVILTFVTYTYSTNNSIKKSKDSIKQMAISEGRALSALVKANMYQAQMIAGDEKIISYIEGEKNEKEQEEIKAYLKGSIQPGEDFEIALLNAEGKVVLTTLEDDRKIRLRSPESFAKVVRGKSCFSDMVFSDQDSNQTINITVPIRDVRNHVIGAVCKIMDNDVFSEFGKSIHIDRTGYAFIIDEKDSIVAHPKAEKEGKLLPQAELRQAINKSVENGDEMGECSYVFEREVKYTAYYIVDDIGWVICITQNLVEMQRQAYVGSLLVVITMFVLIVLVNIVSRKLIKEITTPIDMLIDTMESVGEGKFANYCTYNGDDEFGKLSKNYNKMLSKLGESHENLNKVCEELAVTKQELEYNYQDLVKSKEALVKSEERYKITLDAIDEVIWEYHVKSGHFYATDNCSKLIGHELEGHNISAIIERYLEPQIVETMAYSTQRCLSGEIKDFTQELWITKENTKCCLLCKGHAIANESGNVEKMIGILTDITYNKHNEETVRKLTYFDGLTGCLNKATFIESLDGWLSVGKDLKQAALLFIDLDDFKKINDVLSHEVGDRVLNYIGKELTELIPQDAFIGRFGGDEFVIFKTAITDVDDVHELVYDILSLFQNQMTIDGIKVHLTCSIGIAMYPDDGEDSAMLLKNADTAMYKVKDNGKNSYSFYTKSMSQTLDRKLLIEEALREAVTKNSFYLQYQPVVDLKSEKTMGCEALIRLCDSELGFISPGEFIPIAEETDLIIEAGDWVLENALSALRHLHDQGYKDFTMNINVSSIQMKEENFLEKLEYVIKKTGVLPRSIKLEVTESVLMEDVEKSIEMFNHVKAMGIRIALDDFGTGYSSLNYLRSIPLDILKIDKSFIDEITTSKVLSEIVDSIINMAHALNIAVVAEGVENEMQLEVLKNKGCDLIQGYYYSKPLNESELEARLARENNRN